jgi:RNA polymerase sigma factor (sigma-70 family)
MTRGEVGQLYERFGSSVYRRCLRILGDAALAQDALQDVFVRVLRYGDGFNGTSILGWLHRVADRTCLDCLDRNGRARRPLVDSCVARGAIAPPTAEANRLLSEVLTALPHALRQIAILYYVDDMNQDEIASALECSTMTVKRRLAALHRRSSQLAAAEEVSHEPEPVS